VTAGRSPTAQLEDELVFEEGRDVIGPIMGPWQHDNSNNSPLVQFVGLIR
jgi:hypothetical protein